MNGKVLDFTAVAVVVVVFFGFAIFQTGVANLLVAWFGFVGLGYYNAYVRHDRRLVDATGGGGRPIDHRATLRAAWR